jgi:hypothetical protein
MWKWLRASRTDLLAAFWAAAHQTILSRIPAVIPGARLAAPLAFFLSGLSVPIFQFESNRVL